ncbi:MAG: FAD-binding oxidoreductase, partial [Nocardioides sp.]
MPVDSHEMHPTRWGDPAAAAPLPASARGLIELAFGLDERPAVEHPSLPSSKVDEALLAGLRELFGAEHVLTDDETRRVRTRGKST